MFIEGSYQLSNRVNHNTADDDEEPSDSEDNLDIAMIDWKFSHNDDDNKDNEDDAENKDDDDQPERSTRNET